MSNKIQPRTTIDNLHIEAHRRYAKDQHELDPRFIEEASSVQPHAEIAGTSVIYASQLEQLVESFVGSLPWASFQAPLGYLMQSNRFFRSGLFPMMKKTLQKKEEEEKKDSSDEEEENDEHPLVELFKQNYAARSAAWPLLPQIERDKDTLLSMTEEIGRIDALLSHITARKLQYQKG